MENITANKMFTKSYSREYVGIVTLNDVIIETYIFISCFNCGNYSETKD